MSNFLKCLTLKKNVVRHVREPIKLMLNLNYDRLLNAGSSQNNEQCQYSKSISTDRRNEYIMNFVSKRNTYP